ncbi:MAG: hypothetical protein FJ284_04125 [Planctomycetes bacterium]|nr:hypothetical protein [Planctomycetota bacterium]
MTPRPTPSPASAPQLAALAKLACGVETGDGIAVLCGPPGVGKSLVLRHLVGELEAGGRSVAIHEPAVWLARTAELPAVVAADDAHLTDAADLVRLLGRCRGRRPGAALVLAGEGRLLTLVARDPKLGQAVRIRVSLLPGRLADTHALVADLRHQSGRQACEAPVVETIHELAAGLPADVVRLIELADVVAAARPDGQLTPADVVAVHRRLAPLAA